MSMKVMGATTKAVYLVPCGHAFAEIAIKEIKENTCPECNEGFRREDVVPILPTDESDVERMKRRSDRLRADGLTHSLKKEKGSGKKKRKAEDSRHKKTDPNGQKKRRER